jgi:hypothetical protein
MMRGKPGEEAARDVLLSDKHIASTRSIKTIVGTAVGTKNKTATQTFI